MKTYFKLFMLAALVMGFYASVDAKPGGKHHIKKIMKQLDLSEEQKTQLKELRKNNKPQMKAAHDKVKQARDALDGAFASGASDADLTKMHDDVTAAHNAEKSLRFSSMLEIRKVLTPAQRMQFDQLSMEMKKKRHQKRMGRRQQHKEDDGE